MPADLKAMIQSYVQRVSGHVLPLEIEQAYQLMNEGKMTTNDFKSVVGKHGWHIDLRQPNASPVQIFDPSGLTHDLY